MLKRSTPIGCSHKKLSINTPQDIHKKLSIDPQNIHKKLSIDPQKGFSQKNVHFTRDPSFLFILSSSRSLNPFLGYLTHF
jgi:hypothetical protein